MKRIIAFMLALLVVCALAGCQEKESPSLADQLNQQTEESTEPEQTTPETPAAPETPETPEEPETPAEPEVPQVYQDHRMFDGTYRLTGPQPEGEDTYVVVRGYPEFLMIETFVTMEGSTYSFWAEEFWPDADCFLGDDTTVTGKSQTFSLMSGPGGFSALPEGRTVALTEDGIILKWESLEEEVYVRDETYAYHTTWEAQALVLESMGAETTDPAAAGCWGFWDGWYSAWVQLQEDGAFALVTKEPGAPVAVYEGAWGINEDGDIQIMAEKAGDGQYPSVVTWQWDVDANGYLYLTDEYGSLLKEMGNAVCFWVDEDARCWLYMNQEEAMSYVHCEYDLAGEYTDQYGTEYYYSYRLPVFLDEVGDLKTINDEIREMFVPVIEDELDAMEKDEFLVSDILDYNVYVTEGIVTLHIYTMSYEIERHATWYYDLRTGKQTDSRELIRRLGLEEEEFLDAVRAAAKTCFEDAFSQVPEEYRQEYGYYELLDWTVSDEAVNFDLPIFVDGMDQLCVYGRIGSMAGAAEFWSALYPFGAE